MPPTAREELIKKIQGLVEICPPDCSCSEVIAHFILANYVKKECLVPIEAWHDKWDKFTGIKSLALREGLSAAKQTLKLTKEKK